MSSATRSTATSTHRRGLDFTAAMRLLCQDMVARLPPLAHVDLSRVAFSFSQVRTSAAHGVLATLTPMRFEQGASTTLRRGQRYAAQKLLDAQGREMLYILTFFVPRFLNHSLEEKIATVLHELWHISPAFDGDLRRYPGRCYAHGPSQQAYDAEVDQLAAAWWQQTPPDSLFAWLQHDFRSLVARHGKVFGTRIPRPKLIPVDA